MHVIALQHNVTITITRRTRINSRQPIECDATQQKNIFFIRMKRKIPMWTKIIIKTTLNFIYSDKNKLF